MPRFFRLSLRFLTVVLALQTWDARAQNLPSRPLPYDPSRTAAPATARRGLAGPLGLPFFDDFTSPLEGAPKAANWVPGGGALVNNRLPVHPLTRGVATLDGLKANGQGYGNTSFFGAIDTLTSQPIDLSGYSAANNLYLSFAWQEGSLAGAAQANGGATPVSLELFFLDKNGVWVSQWKQRASGQAVSGFRQKTVAVADARYFHAGFQFQFQATGNLAISRDAWSLDYFVLDANRTAADTTYTDIATGQALSSPLKRFVAMPWWQYNAAPIPANELSTTLATEVTNLNPGLIPTPISWQGTVQERTAGGFASTWLIDSRGIPTQPRQSAITGSAATAPLPTTAAAKTLRYTLALNTRVAAGDRTLPNDTLSRDVTLADYYAFDDGSAESSLSLPATSTGPFQYMAYALDLNKDDQVRGVRIYPIFLNTSDGDNSANRSVTVAVWADNGGQPAASTTPLATQTVNVPNPLPNGQAYYDIYFSKSVPVSGRAYVGYGQAARGQFLPYGLDLNNPPPANTLWRTEQGGWLAFSAIPAGAPMFRALLTNNVVVTATTPAAVVAAAGFALYPNPAHNTVTVSGPAFVRASVLDALGRTVWEQPATEAGRPALNLGSLAAGVYVVRLRLADGSVTSRRLVVTAE